MPLVARLAEYLRFHHAYSTLVREQSVPARNGSQSAVPSGEPSRLHRIFVGGGRFHPAQIARWPLSDQFRKHVPGPARLFPNSADPCKRRRSAILLRRTGDRFVLLFPDG